MVKEKVEGLLKDERVKAEIERHCWLESEKARTDIGFDKASRDWINNYADAWVKAHSKDVVAAVEKRKVRASKHQNSGWAL
ncbi:MAG: hypothetical protein HQL17_05600 [Candidatus Omnitrophica bacterium]|nr:hypothetical protein [Candidatus Omnitrophota bacterium]